MQDSQQMQTFAETHQSNKFLKTFMNIIKINRSFALAPFVTKTDGKKKCYVAVSKTCTIFSYLIIIPLYVGIAVLTVQNLRRNYKSIRIYYSYGRLFLTALTNLSCLRNRHLILNAINRIARLGVPISNKWASLQIAMCIGTVVMTIIGKHQQNMTLREGSVAALYNIVPTMVFISICVQYGCQVVAVRMAIKKLNADIVHSSTEDLRLDKPPLRPIIKYYRDIYKVCSVLNAAYGSPMLFVTSNIFWEATFCTFFLFSTLEYMAIGGKIYVVVWAIFHTLPSLGLLYVCQLTENLSLQTNFLSNKLKRFEDFLNDDTFLERVELHLLFQHQPIRFDARGFFPLNGTHIKTVIATIITYAVILLQNTNKPA